MTMEKQTALIPIAEALPELRADQYAKVREWDACRMRLADGYEQADGEYLIKIRDELQHAKGQRTPLWKAYLDARDIPYHTALRRIQKAEGHVATPRYNDKLSLSPEPEPPAYEPISAWPMMDVGAREPVRETKSLAYGEPWQDEPEWNDTRSGATPLSAYIPTVTPPATPLSRDALPETESQWAHRITEIERETPEVQALPIVRFISALHAINHITDGNINAWLTTSSTGEIQDGADIFQRIEAFAVRVQNKIKQQQRAGLRLVSDQ